MSLRAVVVDDLIAQVRGERHDADPDARMYHFNSAVAAITCVRAVFQGVPLPTDMVLESHCVV